MTKKRTALDEEFGAKIAAVREMATPVAERSLWEAYEDAVQRGHKEHAWVFLSELRMMLEAAGRRREALKIAIRLVREHEGAATYNWLAHALERRGWFLFSRRFFERSLSAADGLSHSINWHESAAAGLARIERRRGGY